MNNQVADIPQQLENARSLIQASDFIGARQTLNEIIRNEPDHLEAWLLLANVPASPREERLFLQNILRLDPSNATIQARLKELVERGASSPNTSKLDSDNEEDPFERYWRLGIIVILFLMLLCGGVFAFNWLFSEEQSVNETISNDANDGVSCEEVIRNALTLTNAGCQTIGVNEVCYGNFRVDSQLNADSPFPFLNVGDVISVRDLQYLSASPLNLNTQEWGIALFQLEANLARTAPGENVSLIVYGDTDLTNASGDLQSFYFTSGFGRVDCEAVPFDGILVNMPDGSAITFIANGAQVTLSGSALLQAQTNESMVVSIFEGSGSVLADGEEVFFGAGQEVRVPLGGENGLSPAGPPSEPIGMVTDILDVSCSLLGMNCSPADLDIVYPDEAGATLVAIRTPGSAGTPVAEIRTPIPDPTFSGPIGSSGTPTATQRVDLPTRTPTRSTGPTATGGLFPTSTRQPLPPALVVTSTSSGNSSTVTPTFTATSGSGPTATGGSTAQSPPTATVTVVTGCAGITVGYAGNGTFTINNGYGGAIRVNQVLLTWPGSNGSLTAFKLKNEVDAWTGNQPAPSGNFDVSAEPPGLRQINEGASTEILFTFSNPPAASGYSISLTFDVGCVKNSAG